MLTEKMQAHRERNEGCLSKALPHEMVFTLLGRDAAAPVAIRRWANFRIATGKNVAADPEIQEAYACANLMDEQRAEIRKELGKRED